MMSGATVRKASLVKEIMLVFLRKSSTESGEKKRAVPPVGRCSACSIDSGAQVVAAGDKEPGGRRQINGEKV